MSGWFSARERERVRGVLQRLSGVVVHDTDEIVPSVCDALEAVAARLETLEAELGIVTPAWGHASAMPFSRIMNPRRARRGRSVMSSRAPDGAV